MAAWAAHLALTGFSYSGVEKSMIFAAKDGTFFWSNGYAWGTVKLESTGPNFTAMLSVLHGTLSLRTFAIEGIGSAAFEEELVLASGEHAEFLVN
jgi:non-lysosomal glucosylceramidase